VLLVGMMMAILAAPQLHAAITDKVTVQLSWKYQYQFAPFIVALEKGFYRDAGLDVELREGGPGINAVDRVIQGKADYGVFSSALLVEYAHGKPVTFLFTRRISLSLRPEACK